LKLNNWKNNTSDNKLTIVLFVIYGFALCWILLFKMGVQFSYMENRLVNFIPFLEPLTSHGKVDYAEIIMNVVIFVPLGIYTGILFCRWSFGRSIFFFFLISLLIEALQFILRIGALDSTDIITNTLGGIIGHTLLKAIGKMFGDSVKAQKFINTVATIGTVIMILFLFLLRTGNLWIRYQ
jgi:glycopeptide antibiotics resistance protein